MVSLNKRFSAFAVSIFILLTATGLTGCTKESVGRWDNNLIQLDINNHTEHNGSLIVNVTMSNVDKRESEGEYVGGGGLPISSVYFNVYDAEGKVYGCSRTNYSERPNEVVIEYNETYYINLTFNEFYRNDLNNTPDILEYRYPNNEKSVKFGNGDADETDKKSLYPLFVAIGIIIGCLILFFILKRKRKVF